MFPLHDFEDEGIFDEKLTDIFSDELCLKSRDRQPHHEAYSNKCFFPHELGIFGFYVTYLRNCVTFSLGCMCAHSISKLLVQCSTQFERPTAKTSFKLDSYSTF